MESDVLFFDGHANEHTIQCNYLNKGCSYAVGIENRGKNNTWGGFKFVGLCQYKLSNIKLAVFMGCNTVGVPTDAEIPNITVYTKTLGTKTTIGWDKKGARFDIQKWTKRFFAAFEIGQTVQQAVNFANSTSYSNSSIKSNYVMWLVVQ